MTSREGVALNNKTTPSPIHNQKFVNIIFVFSHILRKTFVVMKSFFIIFLLATTSGTYAIPLWLRKGLTHTFHPGNAYSEYYTWSAPLRGRIQLAFKTSKQNATLIYSLAMINWFTLLYRMAGLLVQLGSLQL